MSAFEFRRVRPADFAYCWQIYRAAMEPLASTLGAWSEEAQRHNIEVALADEGASILVVDKSDAGWLEVSESRHDIHLGHFYIEADRRGQGLGTRFLEWMIERARRKHKTLTLDVLCNNHGARRLYERLGFKNQSASGVRVRMRLEN
jgi:GNAT superfamily N-acetyltransferase